MTRKETKDETGKTVFYVVDGEINVSVIISELSAMGCKGDELGRAYKTLISESKCYTYENRDTKETLLVIDERSLRESPAIPFVWLFFMSVLWGGMPTRNPLERLIQDIKKDGEEIKQSNDI